MRSFFLAAILLAVGAAALVLVGLNTLSGIYADGNVREFTTVYQTLGWAKYGALLLLLWLADRAVLWRERLGWKRSLLLWLPLALFCAAAYFQWVVMGDALRDYLARNGQPDSAPASPVFYMAMVFPPAFAFTGINAWLVQRRQLRLTSVGLRRSV